MWLATTGKPEGHSLNPVEEDPPESACERRPQVIIGGITAKSKAELVGIKEFSSWPKTIRVVAYILRWRDVLRERVGGRNGAVVTAVEFKRAEKALIKNIQSVSFCQCK